MADVTPSDEAIKWIRCSLVEMKGIASGLDCGDEYSARQRNMIRLIDDIRRNLNFINGESDHG